MHLSDEQTVWMRQMTDKCYRLLRETHPNGGKLAESVKVMIQ